MSLIFGFMEILVKIIIFKVNKEENIRLLPLECDYLTKIAKSQYPEFLPNNSEHFNLMRLAKSALLIQVKY